MIVKHTNTTSRLWILLLFFACLNCSEPKNSSSNLSIVEANTNSGLDMLKFIEDNQHVYSLNFIDSTGYLGNSKTLSCFFSTSGSFPVDSIPDLFTINIFISKYVKINASENQNYVKLAIGNYSVDDRLFDFVKCIGDAIFYLEEIGDGSYEEKVLFPLQELQPKDSYYSRVDTKNDFGNFILSSKRLLVKNDTLYQYVLKGVEISHINWRYINEIIFSQRNGIIYLSYKLPFGEYKYIDRNVLDMP